MKKKEILEDEKKKHQRNITYHHSIPISIPSNNLNMWLYLIRSSSSSYVEKWMMFFSFLLKFPHIPCLDVSNTLGSLNQRLSPGLVLAVISGRYERQHHHHHPLCIRDSLLIWSIIFNFSLALANNIRMSTITIHPFI